MSGKFSCVAGAPPRCRRAQRPCDSSGSTLRPITLSPRRSNSRLELATRSRARSCRPGVKSAGCEKSTPQESPRYSWKREPALGRLRREIGCLVAEPDGRRGAALDRRRRHEVPPFRVTDRGPRSRTGDNEPVTRRERGVRSPAGNGLPRAGPARGRRSGGARWRSAARSSARCSRRSSCGRTKSSRRTSCSTPSGAREPPGERARRAARPRLAASADARRGRRATA